MLASVAPTSRYPPGRGPARQRLVVAAHRPDPAGIGRALAKTGTVEQRPVQSLGARHQASRPANKVPAPRCSRRPGRPGSTGQSGCPRRLFLAVDLPGAADFSGNAHQGDPVCPAAVVMERRRGLADLLAIAKPSRTCWIPSGFQDTSSVSVMSSPSLRPRAAAQQVQGHRSRLTRSRGRCPGNDRRDRSRVNDATFVVLAAASSAAVRPRSPSSPAPPASSSS